MEVLAVMTGSGAWDGQLAKRIATVDEEPGAGSRRRGDAPQHLLTGLRVAPVERADADGEHEVERLLAGLQRELLGRDEPQAHPAGPDLVRRRGLGLGDGGDGSVDAEDLAGDEPRRDRTGGRSRPAADLENAEVRLDRKAVHDGGESG